MRVVFAAPEGGGWHPITHMVRLLVELFDAELVTVTLNRPANAWRRVIGIGPRRRGRGTCLVVAAEPRHLNNLLGADYWMRGYEQVAGWIVDSFWIDRIPSSACRHFDRLFVADKELVEDWSLRTGVPVSWLPWGSDVLRLGSGAGDRPVDLQRLGRQPAGWEDDDTTRKACEAAGLVFESRPPMRNDATENEVALMGFLARAKFVLAFSNFHSPAPYTHPTREYLTGRWTDSLASGAVVAGIAPKVAATTELLWPGALLELDGTDRGRGIERIAAGVESWDPQAALENHRRALERLDWRWRFAELAKALDVHSGRLEVELDSLAGALR